MDTAPRYSLVLLVLASSIAMTCLGCGGSPSSAPPPAKTLTSVVVTPASAALQVGAAQQFAAAAKYSDGSTTDVSTAASWQTASQAQARVSSIGLVTGVASGATSVTASFSGMSGTATLTVTMTSVAVSPSAVSIGTGATQQFTATVGGLSNASVTWSVDGVASGNITVGTISSIGLDTAPAQAGIHTVTATSVADNTQTASASISVGTVSVSPASAFVNGGATEQFSATVQGFTNTAVTWSVDGVIGGSSAVGTITAAGAYTAPSQVGSHTIMATSVADSSLAASA